MPQCLNISRESARSFLFNDFGKDCAWISIGEPETPESEIVNNVLDSLPRLKISFWDCAEVVEVEGDLYLPPSEKDAAQIVNFVLQNRGKNFLINCAAGKSRSGAVCAFLEKHLGYEWLEEGKTRTFKKVGPNKLLLKMMEDYYYQ